MSEQPNVTRAEAVRIAEILKADANSIAQYYDKHRDTMPLHANLGLLHEMGALRALAEKINPPPKDDE